MNKTFKEKITLVYLSLVITIGIVGICSVINLYNLKNSIDGLMVDNYKSIKASDNMSESLEKLDLIVISSIYNNTEDNIDEFYKESDEFFKFYNIEAKNVTEKGEEELIKELSKQYLEYIKDFSSLQIIARNSQLEEAVMFYNDTMIQTENSVRNTLNDIRSLNEQSMLNNKDKVTNDAQNSMYLILIISTFAVIGGFVLSKYYLDKVLKPIHLLTETIKRVKEGDLNQQSPIISEDEIGVMAKEFNNMTKRLYEFERSTLGKLLEERNKTMAIVKSSSTPLIVLDTNYKITLLNKAFEEFFNIEEKKVLNKHFLEAVDQGKIFDYISRSYKVINSTNEHKEQIINFHIKGEEYYFNVIVTRVANSDDEEKVNGVVVVFQDVTQLKQIENMKTEFISTISHEFKTPLTSLMMGTSIFTEGSLGEINSKQREVIDTIKEDSEKLLALVNDLLKLSKLEKEFYNLAKGKKIDLSYEVQNGLPAIMGDFEKLTWVVNNLISNAIKYSLYEDKINVRAYKSDSKIYISIKDTGIGIPEDYLDKFFERFVQIRPEDSENKGTGLGLSICKQIVEIHKGEIWCDSTLGEGSEFIIALPINEEK